MDILPAQKQDTDSAYFENVHAALSANPSAGQRDFAVSMDMSLGSTNALVRRFVRKGWLCMRKLNAHTIQYLVTPEGLNVLAHRSYRYLCRTFGLVQQYQQVVDCVVKENCAAGIGKVVMQKQSDLGFLFDSACRKYGAVYSEADGAEMKALVLQAEHTLFVTEEPDTAAEISGHTEKGCTVVSIIGILQKSMV
jgi:hypothetical protein